MTPFVSFSLEPCSESEPFQPRAIHRIEHKHNSIIVQAHLDYISSKKLGLDCGLVVNGVV